MATISSVQTAAVRTARPQSSAAVAKPAVESKPSLTRKPGNPFIDGGCFPLPKPPFIKQADAKVRANQGNQLHDIADGTRWAIAQGIVDPQRICIAGASYGGYATLMGLVNDPALFKCGVNWVGVTDIALLHNGQWHFESDATERQPGMDARQGQGMVGGLAQPVPRGLGCGRPRPQQQDADQGAEVVAGPVAEFLQQQGAGALHLLQVGLCGLQRLDGPVHGLDDAGQQDADHHEKQQGSELGAAADRQAEMR